MTIIFSNFFNTTLAQPLPAAGTSMIVANAANAPALSVGDVFPITLNDAATGTVFEIVYCTAISGTTFTIERNQEGTPVNGWQIGDRVFSGPTADTVLPAGGNGTTINVGTAIAGSDAVPLNQAQTLSTSGNAATATTATNVSGGFVNATTGAFSSAVTIQNATGNNNPVAFGQLAALTGKLLSVQVLANGAIYQPTANKPNFVIGKLVGGGGGGGAGGIGANASGSGGGSGGECEFLIPSSVLGTSGITVALGAGGVGATSDTTTYGNPGAASSFGTLVTAGGGLGGTSTNAAVCVLGGGGGSLPTVATGVTILSAKQGNCSENWAIAAAGGKGANSSVGEGGQGAINTAPLLANATSGGIGAGGGGGTNTGSASSEQGGGSGGEGYCIIFEYK